MTSNSSFETPIRVLLIDDEPTLREPLSEYLTAQGFDVSQAENATQARTLMTSERPDIALLDIMMPGEDGLSLSRHLIEAHQLPIIFLSARSEATDRIIGLELGADDYIVKPFEPRELIARIRSVLRRTGAQSTPSQEQHDWLYQFCLLYTSDAADE